MSFKVTRLLLAREDREAQRGLYAAGGSRSGVLGADFRIHGEIQQPGGCRRERWCSSNREGIGALDLAPAESMRAAAPRCLLPGTSHAIGKRLSGRLNGTSVAPEFTPKHNSELSDNRGRRPHAAVRLEIGEYEGASEKQVETCLRIRTGISTDADV